MNKLTKILAGGAVLISLPAIQPIQIQADDSYALACEAYEVDTVNTSGEKPVFNQVNCYGSNEFETAKAAMKAAGDNAVLRHVNAKSPMKIIAMSGGLAYSYPRNGKGTMTVTDPDNGASTYMPAGRELYYLDTTKYDPSTGAGTISVEVTGFDGTSALENTDLIPFYFTDSNATMPLGGSGSSGFSNKIQISYYEVVQNGNYKDLVFHAWSNRGYSVFSRAVGPAASWMNVGDVYYSSDDVNYYTDIQHRNKAGEYYNFYEFVPLRTQSVIPEETYNSYLQSASYFKQNNISPSTSKLWNSGSYFLADQDAYGMNAAMVFAQAVCESAYGTSNFALNRNNLFGVNAVDSNPNQASYYASVKDAIDNQTAWLLREYLDDNDWRCFGGSFGNKGTGITVKYASSIYYGITLAANYYDFDKFANNYDGNLTDYNSITFGVINNSNAWTYISPDASGTPIHNFQNTTGYQKNVTVSILGEDGEFYKIQSQHYINEDGSRPTINGKSAPDWDWETQVFYMKKSDITILYNHLSASDTDKVAVYRLFNRVTGEHLYTTDMNEYNVLGQGDWDQEKIKWYAPASGTKVTRLFNKVEGGHLYTTDQNEIDTLAAQGNWVLDGDSVTFNSGTDGTVINRLFNTVDGQHLLTMDQNEISVLTSGIWVLDETVLYGISVN